MPKIFHDPYMCQTDHKFLKGFLRSGKTEKLIDANKPPVLLFYSRKNSHHDKKKNELKGSIAR